MGSTTYKEYSQHFEKDRALARRFQKIDVVEPTVPDTIKILTGLQAVLRGIPRPEIHQRSHQHGGGAVGRYITDRKLPDKAIDVIDEAGAAQWLLPAAKRRKQVGVRDIEIVVAKMARIPPKQVDKSDAEQRRNRSKPT